MEKINIVQFVETLGTGGLENVVYNIATGLNPDIFDVKVVCRIDGGDTAKRVKKAGIPIEILNKRKLNVFEIINLINKITNNKNTILHCHGLFTLSSESIVGRITGIKTIFIHIHNLVEPLSLYQRLKLMILKRSAYKFIAVSKKVEDSLLQNSIKNVSTIHNGIDIKNYKFISQAEHDHYGFPAENFVLGMIGRIVKRKGFDCFIQFIKNTPNTSGIIVGEGPYENRVKKMINSQNLGDRIRCIPFQSQDMLPSIYSTIDALFLFSEKEGLPLSILEAQSTGVPYIGNSVGGIGEIVKDGYNGFILEDSDIDKFRDAIRNINGNPTFYRNNSRRTVEKGFSVEHMVQNIEKQYMKSLKL